MQLGQMIVKLRKEQGLTQETFAKKFNVTRQTVSNWENEKSYPDLHTLVKISDEFNLSLDILLKGNPTMVNDIDKKVKKHTLYKGIILGANYAQTECQFRYCGTAIPFLTVRSTAR